MKTCSVCGESKAELNFFYRDRRTGTRHSQCKECYAIKRRRIWREHYHKHGSEYRQRAIERNRKLKLNLRKLLFEYLSDKSCVICGITDYRVLEFDHINPLSKSFSISQGVHGILSWTKILAEIEKCQILCANCHKIKTSKEQGWYSSLAEIKI